MKKTIKLFGFIALAAVMTFAMTSCSDGGGGSGPSSTPTKTAETAKYVSFDEATGNRLELVITEDVANARYTAKKDDTYVLTIYAPDGTVLATSKGKVSSASGNEIVLEHSTGAVITVAVSTSGDNSIITSLDTDDDTIPVDTGSPAQAKPALISYTPGLKFELIEEGDNAGTYSVSYGDAKGVDVVIPASYKDKPVTTIAAEAFADTGITSVSIPSSVKLISWKSFTSTSLTSVNIPSSVTFIGWAAFQECTSLASVTFAAGSQLQTIRNNAFNGCTGITSITIPSKVTEIDVWAFVGCTGLTNITIPSSVTYIREGAFNGCTSVTSITIPEDIEFVGKGVFGGWTTSQTIYIRGHASMEEANAAWDEEWLIWSNPTIKFWNGSSYQ